MLFYFLVVVFSIFILWLGYKILLKAGLDGWWTITLFIPVINIVMIWVFAFCHWPNVQKNSEQDL